MISFNRIAEWSAGRGKSEPTGVPLSEVETALRQSLAKVRAAVAEHPRTSLVAAFGAGLMLAWWIKRR